MACEDLRDIIKEYETIADTVKDICRDKARTLDDIKKILKLANVEITDGALIYVMDQIEGMMTFTKDHTYDIGDAIIYMCWWNLTFIPFGKTIGNKIVKVEYKNFYLYNDKMFHDDAFREYIFSKLKFEESSRTDVDNSKKLLDALEQLHIEKGKWKNYIFVNSEHEVYCRKWHGNSSSTEYLGKLIKVVRN